MTSPRGAQWAHGLLAGSARGLCQRGSELGLERWPGSGACGRRRQRVQGSRGRSRDRRRGWTGRGACESRKSPVHSRRNTSRSGRFRLAERRSPLITAPHSRALAAGLGLPQAPTSPSPVSSNSGQKPQEGDYPESQPASWPAPFSRRPGSVGVLSLSPPLQPRISEFPLPDLQSPLLPFESKFIFPVHWESCPRDPKYLRFVYPFPASGALLPTRLKISFLTSGLFCFVFLLPSNSCFRNLSPVQKLDHQFFGHLYVTFPPSV